MLLHLGLGMDWLLLSYLLLGLLAGSSTYARPVESEPAGEVPSNAEPGPPMGDPSGERGAIIAGATPMEQAQVEPAADSADSQPRVVMYSQTRQTSAGPVSILPLLQTGATHINIAAFHINEDPDAITLNDDHPLAPMYDDLWDEVRTVRESGVKVLGMLGGAAPGSFVRLTGTDEEV